MAHIVAQHTKHIRTLLKSMRIFLYLKQVKLYSFLYMCSFTSKNVTNDFRSVVNI